MKSTAAGRSSSRGPPSLSSPVSTPAAAARPPADIEENDGGSLALIGMEDDSPVPKYRELNAIHVCMGERGWAFMRESSEMSKTSHRSLFLSGVGEP